MCCSCDTATHPISHPLFSPALFIKAAEKSLPMLRSSSQYNYFHSKWTRFAKSGVSLQAESIWTYVRTTISLWCSAKQASSAPLELVVQLVVCLEREHNWPSRKNRCPKISNMVPYFSAWQPSTELSVPLHSFAICNFMNLTVKLTNIEKYFQSCL